MNFKLIVDFQLHPIASFLKNNKTEYSDLVLENKNNIDYVCYGAVEVNEITLDGNLLIYLKVSR